MFTRDADQTEMRKKKTRLMFFVGAIPLLFAVIAATYYANQRRPSEFLVAELKNIVPLGEIVQYAPVEQHLKCPVDKLESFRLMGATFVRTNSSRYKVTIDGEYYYGVEEFLIDSRQLKDNSWIDFKLKKPFDRCKGRPLKILIESADATSGNAITLYTASRYYEGKIMQPKRGDLYNRQLALEVNTIIGDAETPQLETKPASPATTTASPESAAATLIAQIEKLDNFGEIITGNAIEQSISCPVEKLSTLKMMTATYVRTNSARYKISLQNGSEKPQEMMLDARSAKDNDWVLFRLSNPIEKCFGKPLTLKIESIDAKPGNAITFYHRPNYYVGKLKGTSETKLAGRQLLLEMNR